MPTPVTNSLISSLYLAYYGRPADPGGLQYWGDILEEAEQRGGDGLGQLINAFANSPESLGRFQGVGTEQFVNKVYQSLFNRTAEPDGLLYWSEAINSQQISLGKAVLAILQGAQDGTSQDRSLVTLRNEVCLQFTQNLGATAYSGNAAADVATLLAAGVTLGTTPQQISDMLQAAKQLVQLASDQPATYNALLGSGNTALELIGGSANPLAVMSLISAVISAAVKEAGPGGDPALQLSKLLGKYTALEDVLKNLPIGTSLQDLTDAVNSGGLASGGAEAGTNDPSDPPPPPPPPFTVTVTLADQSPAFVEKVGADDATNAQVINSDITLSGVGSVTSATVAITNTQTGDELLFADTLKIQGVVAVVSGNKVLTLTAKPGQTTTNADFEMALETVKFNNAVDAPSTTSRTIEFKVANGGRTSTGATETLALTTTNDAPVLALSAGNTAYIEAAGGVAVDALLVLSDPDSGDLSAATVRITSGYQTGADVLSLVGNGLAGNITSSFDAASGTLTLTSAGGNATLTQWQEALRLVRFDSSSTSPGTQRVISLQVDDGDGGAQVSTVSTKTIDVTQVNSAPALTGGGVAAFVENSGAVVLDAGVVVADPDTAVLTGATVSITAGFVSGQDVLSFTSVGAITGTYNSATGVLSLSGAGSPADYQQVLRSVSYGNASNAPSTAARTIQFQVNDGQGVSNLSNTTSVNLSVSAINDMPVLGGGGSVNYMEAGQAVAISLLLTVADVDSVDFDGGTLTVAFSANGTTADQLTILNQGTGVGQIGVNGANVTFGGAVVGTFAGGENGASLVVALNAFATAAAVQALARVVAFSNNSSAPSTAPRTVTYTVVDGDGGADTGSVNAIVNVTNINDAPLVSVLPMTLAYTEDANPTVIAGAMTVTDTDSVDFNGGSLTVSFAANGTAADQLAVRNEGNGADQIGVSGSSVTFGGTTIGSIAGGTNGSSLTVSFTSAAATPGAVQALGRNITYANTSGAPSTLDRTVTFAVADGDGGQKSGDTTINVTAVNDAPVVGGGGTLAYGESSAAAAISPSGTVTDPDSTDFNGGSLTVSLTSNGTVDDNLGIIHQGTGAGQVGVNGAGVSFGGASIGTFSGGTNGGDLVITFNASDATPAAVQALMKAISFSNSSDAPSTAARTVTYTISDGDGGAQVGSTTATVSVTAINDAPITVVPSSASLGTAMSNVEFAVAGVSVSDVDAANAFVQTTVTVTNGTAAFSLAGGATVAAGANGSTSVTLQGTVAQVNAALSTFTFKGSDGVTQPVTSTVSVMSSDLGNTGSGGALQSNGGVANTFQIGVIPQVFVIDNSTSVVDDSAAGTIANPFNSVAGFNTFAADGINDFIYLKHGTGNYSEADGFVLLAGQQLIGQGESLSFVNPVTNEVVSFGPGASGSTPTMSLTGTSNQAVTLASGNTLKGLDLATSHGSQTALVDGGGTVGSLTILNVNITGSGMAVDIDQGGALNVVIDNLSSSGSTQQGVQLAATGATLTGAFTALTGTIANASGVEFLVGDGSGGSNTGGALQIHYSGAITASGAGAAVSIEDRVVGAGSVSLSGGITRSGGEATTINIDDIAAGAITLSGDSTLNSGAAAALSIADISAGVTIGLSGNLDIDTTSGSGIVISNNNGAVSFTGGQVTVNTGAGTGVQISGGTGNTLFNLSGNDLDIVTSTGVGFNVADAGTVTVQGDSNTITSTNAIGLSVTNSTIGANDLNFQSINASNGIVLDSTGTSGGLTVTGAGVANSGGTISSATGSAVTANQTQDLNLAWVNILNPAGRGIVATDLRGVNSLSNSTISGFGTAAGNAITENGLEIINNNVNMTSLAVTNTTFTNASGSNDGIFMEAQGSSNMTLSVNNSNFSQFYGDAIQVNGISGSSGTVRVTVKDSDFTNAATSGNGGISLNPFGNLSLFADVDGNVFSGVLNSVSTIGAIGVTNGMTANADITIRNNDLDNIIGGRGITVTADGGTTDLLIDSNSIDGLGSNSKPAINVNYINNTPLGSAASGNVTISNNLIGQNGSPLWMGGDGTANAVLVHAQNGASMTALIQGNAINANTSSVIEVVRVRASSTTGNPGGTVNATVTANTILDTSGSHVEFDATAGTSTLAGTVNLSISGNNLGGAGVVKLTENAAGTVNVSQASESAVSVANSNATVTITGSPTFGASAPPLPTTPSLPLLALQGPVEGRGADALSSTTLQTMAEAAIARWVGLGINGAQLQLLESVSFGVADLKGSVLGLSTTGLVLVDSNAAGWGWFVDTTPLLDEEFAQSAGQPGAAMDLLTVLVHELGHILGFADHYGSDDGDVMSGYLDVGQRHVPEVSMVGVSAVPYSDAP